MISGIGELRQANELLEDSKKELIAIVKRTSEISALLNNISEIGKNIRKEDFELSRFGNQLMQMDKEKLELMRKIDTLERLISRMRRQ